MTDQRTFSRWHIFSNTDNFYISLYSQEINKYVVHFFHYVSFLSLKNLTLRMKVHYIYTYQDHNETLQTLVEKGGRWEENGNIMEG
jgi:hypothetical protein